MARPPKPRRPGPRRPRPRAAAHEGDGLVLYGIHPVLEALRNPDRAIRRLLATENAAARLQADLGHDIPALELVRPEAISRMVEADAVHQGVWAEVEPLPAPEIADLAGASLVLALDQITDPHNVGAIVRTAAAFAVAAIVTTVRHSPSATGVLAKSASGGLEHVPFVSVRNLAEALLELQAEGFRLVGLDSEGGTSLRGLETGTPTVLVLGAEGKGLRQRTRDICDVVARLDMPGAIHSLNVSNAAAIALYALAPNPGSQE